MCAASSASILDIGGADVGNAAPHDGAASPLEAAGVRHDLPLCVDLDGTLLRTDALHEQLLVAATRWRLLRRLPGWLRRGGAHLKQQLAQAVPLDVATLPYDEALLTYLRAQRVSGRRLVLATAADRRLADAVNAHLGLFDEVIASDGGTNLRGDTKAARLCATFGERRFCYVGSDRSDLAIWHKAAGAVFANSRHGIVRAARAGTPVEARIGAARPRLSALRRALRPHQWSKNLLVFIPILAAGALTDGSGWLSALFMFAAFCCAASGIYLINDLTDLAADRRHPRKRYRPFASGDLPVVYGAAFAPPLIVASGLLALRCGAAAAGVVGAYVLLSLVYSLKLKEKPLVDVFGLAALYSIRLFGGGIASDHPVSLWLMMFSSFLFFSLACTKRDAEMISVRREKEDRLRRRGYLADDQRMLEMMGIGASFVSSMVLALYVENNAESTQWSHPQWLWAMVPLLLFWQCRLWLATSRGYMLDDPVVYASRDWVSQGVAVLLAVVYLLAVAPV
ncbi:MAG: UbiA family prenyltransferase [Alphaproteobacteria bacterium]|nr:UbiA family prenyltransferase [Alphaproteobacteria bacterium]